MDETKKPLPNSIEINSTDAQFLIDLLELIKHGETDIGLMSGFVNDAPTLIAVSREKDGDGYRITPLFTIFRLTDKIENCYGDAPVPASPVTGS